MASTRQQILEALRDRLQAITQDAGFATNAGRQVLLGEAPSFGPDDPVAAIAILVGEDQVSRTGEHAIILLPVLIAALARADLDQPWVAVEQVLEDIKRAVELEDRTLGRLLRTRMERGSTRTLERDEGQVAIGAAITYVLPYAEVWGQP